MILVPVSMYGKGKQNIKHVNCIGKSVVYANTFCFGGNQCTVRIGKKDRQRIYFAEGWQIADSFLGGMIFLVPFQTLYARKYFDNYGGSILNHWNYFFTHLTDFSGYDGAFTPGHLWFILFLF